MYLQIEREERSQKIEIEVKEMNHSILDPDFYCFVVSKTGLLREETVIEGERRTKETEGIRRERRRR